MKIAISLAWTKTFPHFSLLCAILNAIKVPLTSTIFFINQNIFLEINH